MRRTGRTAALPAGFSLFPSVCLRASNKEVSVSPAARASAPSRHSDRWTQGAGRRTGCLGCLGFNFFRLSKLAT